MDDFYFLKLALANWSARMNYLVGKWTKELDVAEQYDGTAVALIQRFIADLKAPALSDLDFKDDVDLVANRFRKRIDATQINLLDDDYVRQSF